MKNKDKIIILGSGVAGLSAGYHLVQNNVFPIIYEKNNDWGGLCGNFFSQEFRFDKFIHLSFTKNDYVIKMFSENTPFFSHPPLASNYYQGVWLTHPAQNNLFTLSIKEKIKIILDFIKREKKNISEIQDYDTWLNCQYGGYFAENFPKKYTKKYWGVNAKELETKWIGERMHCPSLKEMCLGAIKKIKKNYYYASVMRYPKKGGYKSFLNNIRKNLEIKLNKEAININTDKKEVKFSDGSFEKYTKLISSIPLPEIVKILDNTPQDVIKAAQNLRYTSGYIVSVGLRNANKIKDLWFYVYDEDIPFARVYSPSLKSADNAPENCHSLQAEIFFANDSKKISPEEALEKTVQGLIKMGVIILEDIILTDIRLEKYANIIFDHNIYKNREIILKYLKGLDIKSIGRFGEWDYFWSDQAFISGKESAEELLTEIGC